MQNIGFVVSIVKFFIENWLFKEVILIAIVWYIFHEGSKHPIDNFWRKAKLYSVIALLLISCYAIYDSYDSVKNPKITSTQLPY